MLRSVRTTTMGRTLTLGRGISLSRVNRQTDRQTGCESVLYYQTIGFPVQDVLHDSTYSQNINRHMHKSITDQNHIFYKIILLKWIDQDVKLTDKHVSLLYVLAKIKLRDKYAVRY